MTSLIFFLLLIGGSILFAFTVFMLHAWGHRLAPSTPEGATPGRVAFGISYTVFEWAIVYIWAAYLGSLVYFGKSNRIMPAGVSFFACLFLYLIQGMGIHKKMYTAQAQTRFLMAQVANLIFLGLYAFWPAFPGSAYFLFEKLFKTAL